MYLIEPADGLAAVASAVLLFLSALGLGLVGSLLFTLLDSGEEVGFMAECDRHSWTTGPAERTSRWQAWSRSRWHKLTRHSLPGQQPLYETDEWIVANSRGLRALSLSRRHRRMCERGLRLAARNLGDHS